MNNWNRIWKPIVVLSLICVVVTGALAATNEVTAPIIEEATIAAEAEVELLPGMKVSAKVLNESVENVVVVSMDALQFDAYNQPYVLKLSGREYVQVPVTVGINDGTSVQILSGVSAGETVYIRRSVLDMMGMTGG